MRKYHDIVPSDYTWMKGKTFGEQYHLEIKKTYRCLLDDMRMARTAYKVYNESGNKEMYKIYIATTKRISKWFEFLANDKRRASNIDRTR